MENEIWKDIAGYADLYQVSNFGSVRSLPRVVKGSDGRLRHIQGRRLSCSKDNRGYLSVALYQDGNYRNCLIHRLVATAFLECTDTSLQVNHIDGNKQNNCVSNLEWVTSSANVAHARCTRLSSTSADQLHRMAAASAKVRSVPVRCVEDGRTFPSERSAAAHYQISVYAVNDSVKDGKPHCGYTFQRIHTPRRLVDITFPDPIQAAKKQACPVRCVETNEIYASRGQAARALNIPESSIYDSLRDGRAHNGYTFQNVESL